MVVWGEEVLCHHCIRRGGLVTSLYQERRFSDIVVLGEEV